MRRRWLKPAAFVLGLLACLYLGKGLHGLLIDPRGAVDLNQRFQEVHLFWHLPISAADQNARLDRTFVLERWDGLNYLPSSHVFGVVFTPPLPWKALRIYYALLNLAALAALMVAMVRLTKGSGLPAWWLVPSLLACSNICSALGNGQYGIIVVTLLSWSLLADRTGRSAATCVQLVLATVKPVLCAPYFLGLLAYRRWVQVVCSAVVAGGVLAWGFWRSPDPLLVHLHNYQATSALTMTRGFGLNSLVLGVGLPQNIVSLAGLIFAVITMGGLAILRPRLLSDRPLIFLGIGGFVCRAWFPLTEYDNVMLLPLFAAMLAEAAREGRPAGFGLAVVMSISLWIPARWMINGPVATAQWLVWLVVVFYLIRRAREPDPLAHTAKLTGGETHSLRAV